MLLLDMFLHTCALMRYVFAYMSSYEIFLETYALRRYVFACMCSYEICFCIHVLL